MCEFFNAAFGSIPFLHSLVRTGMVNQPITNQMYKKIGEVEAISLTRS
jgi:hypothetical protein